MVFSLGQPAQAGQWYWCPPNPTYFTFPIAFGSRNWDLSPAVRYQLGEQGRGTGEWVNGSGGPSCTSGATGPPDWWQNGVPASANLSYCFHASGGVALRGQATFCLSWVHHGSYTWAALAGNSPALVECWGAGNPGNKSRLAGGNGDGGGGGAYASISLAVTGGLLYTVTVGAAAAAWQGPSGNSFFGDQLTVMAQGAMAGTAPGSSLGSVGDVRYNGGIAGLPLSSQGGGGGSSASAGGRGQYSGLHASNIGGVGPPGSGAGGNGSHFTGQSGHSPGGGGAGGGDTTIGFPGGQGGDGKVKVSWQG